MNGGFLEIFIPILEVLIIGVPLINLMAQRGLPSEERSFITRVAMAGFLIRLAVATAFVAFPELRIFHEDSDGYELGGWSIASGWMGEGPYIGWDQIGSSSFVGFCAILYYVFGRYRLVVSAFMSVFGGLSIVLVYRLSRQIFHPIVARRAALLAAFFPSMILWSAMALKDPLMMFLLLVGLGAALGLRRRFQWGSLIALILIVPAIWFIRFYITYFFLFAVGASMLVVHGRNRFGTFSTHIITLFLVVGTISLFGLTKKLEVGLERMNLESAAMFRSGMAISAKSGFAHDADVSTVGGALAFLPVGLSVLLLGPFPWQLSSSRALFTMPEVFLWWAMIPAVIRGVRFAIRKEIASTAPLIIFLATLSVAYSLSLGNVGAVIRQRAQIFIFLFIFAALGHYVGRCQKRGVDPDLLRQPY